MNNRLNLNFSLNTVEERTSFVHEYLSSIDFVPNETELNKISDYILWGNHGDNATDIELSTHWTTAKLESYDALLESPTFNEASLTFQTAPARIKKEVFSRAECRSKCPASLLHQFEELWTQIDETELITNYYEINHGKRVKPPRDELLKRITANRQAELDTFASTITQYQYLKLRHLLVELRRDQYVLRDSFTQTIAPQTIFTYSEPTSLSLENEIDVRPLGLIPQTPTSPIWTDSPNPFLLNEADLAELTSLIWRPRTTNRYYIDFTDPTHIYAFLSIYDEIDELTQLSATFDFYESIADLSPLQRELLQLKRSHKSNDDIARTINSKYNKSYNTNYISTIYHQRIIPSIAEAAARHFEIVQNLFYPENFKKCTKCGKVLLRDNKNFMKQAKSRDGFAPRCKKCNKEDRNERIARQNN